MRDIPTERQLRIQMKDMLDRMKKHKAAQKEREEMQYPYSGSDEDQVRTGFIRIYLSRGSDYKSGL